MGLDIRTKLERAKDPVGGVMPYWERLGQSQKAGCTGGRESKAIVGSRDSWRWECPTKEEFLTESNKVEVRAKRKEFGMEPMT